MSAVGELLHAGSLPHQLARPNPVSVTMPSADPRPKRQSTRPSVCRVATINTTRVLLRDNNNTTIIRAPRRRGSHPDCRCLPILIAALQHPQIDTVFLFLTLVFARHLKLVANRHP